MTNATGATDARTPSGRGPYVFRPTDSPLAASRWTPRHELATNVRAVIGRAYPRLIGAAREPSWLAFEILLPFLATSAFVFVYRALGAPEEYIGFVVLGGAMTAFWLNVMWLMAGQLWWDKDAGNLVLYMTAPIGLMSIMFGMALGGIGMTATRAAVVLGIGSWLYGVQFSVEQWALLLAVFLLTLTALYSLGVLLSGLFVMWGREAWHLTRLAEEPVYFVSGLNFPVGRLGILGALAISIIPLAVGLDALRQLAFTGGVGAFGTPGPEIEALILVAMTAVFLGLGRVLLRRIEWLARNEGKLTSRGE